MLNTETATAVRSVLCSSNPKWLCNASEAKSESVSKMALLCRTSHGQQASKCSKKEPLHSCDVQTWHKVPPQGLNGTCSLLMHLTWVWVAMIIIMTLGCRCVHAEAHLVTSTALSFCSRTTTQSLQGMCNARLATPGQTCLF